jgi:CHASE2 domain-containing sensor protein
VLEVLSSLRAHWQSWNQITQHGLKNIVIGAGIEWILIPLLHLWVPVLLITVENLALDRMMAITAIIGGPPRAGRSPPRQIFVNVDDVTWRGKDWGGGEPDRAPRTAVLELVKTAFSHEATQVVVDIVIEGNNKAHPEQQKEDEEFAKELDKLKDNISKEKQLVLVRSVRRPLGQLALAKGNSLRNLSYPALSEIRESPSIDEVVKNSGGRIVVAAPYFVYSADRILRDWRLLKVVCQPNGRLHVVPSVQLLVAARHFGVSAENMPMQPDDRCTPLPDEEVTELPLMSDVNRRQTVIEKQERDASISYWESLRSLILRIKRVDIGEAPFDKDAADDLGNRVVFRSGANLQSDGYFSELSARLLLKGDITAERLKSLFSGRVAVIGQSFVEAGDQHHTPMGQMPGSVVLMNAIDSMIRYPLIHPPAAWKEQAVMLLLILLVGYLFARWNSAMGLLISIALALPALIGLSAIFFNNGVWLDFFLPLVGIFVHREYKSFEERLELRKLAGQLGLGEQQ